MMDLGWDCSITTHYLNDLLKLSSIYHYSAKSRIEATRVVLCCFYYLPWSLGLLCALWTVLGLLVVAKSWSSVETGVNLCSFYLIFFVYFEYRIFALVFTNSPSQRCKAFLLKRIRNLKIDLLLNFRIFLHNFLN